MTTEQTERKYPPFVNMVTHLIKQMPGEHGTLMHGAIGVAGECAGELPEAHSRANLLEECGDIEFYMAVCAHYAGVSQAELGFDVINFGNVLSNISCLSGALLDVVKKSWVYNKPLNVAEVDRCLRTLRSNLDFLYELLATTRKQVQHMNQVKLIGPGGRFESGFYSDAAAIARADKPAGE